MQKLNIADLDDSPANKSTFLGIYSFWDNEAKRFDTPFFCQNDLFAKRHYTMVTSKDGTMIHTFQKSFDVYRLGWFDLLTGETHEDKLLLIDGAKIKKQEDND